MAVGFGAHHGFMASPYAACERHWKAVRGAIMNSEERRAARRARRDEKRAANRQKRNGGGCSLESIASTDSLYEAARLSARGVRWKASVQRYEAHVLRNILKARNDLLSGKYIRRGFVRFDISERGKLRHITSVHFSERVIQKSISKNSLAPSIWPTLTPGCSANIKGRGTDYALIRLKRQLAEHQRRHGTDGYVLLIDFSDYFGRIDHGAAKALVARTVSDERVRRLVNLQIDACGDVGLGLGSEPNQVLAVAVPSPIDHLLERTPGIEASGRYMDDTYAIALEKQTLWDALDVIRSECMRLGITINERKTKVIKLTRGFVFLKKKFRFTKSGRIVVRPCRESLTRERRRMKKHAAMVKAGRMTVEQARQSYISWRGSIDKRKGKPRLVMNTHDTVRDFDRLFFELFGERP